MIGMYASAIALVVAGAATGILVMVCLGIKRDDRPGGFPADAHDRTARAARKMTGARTRSPEPAPRPAAGRTSCRFSQAAVLAAPGRADQGRQIPKPATAGMAASTVPQLAICATPARS